MLVNCKFICACILFTPSPQLSAASTSNQSRHVKTEELEMKTLKRKTPLKQNECDNIGSSTKQVNFFFALAMSSFFC